MAVHLYVVINYPYAGVYSSVMNYEIITTIVPSEGSEWLSSKLHADTYCGLQST